MNPLSHAQFAQDTHREYEAEYGNRYLGTETSKTEQARASQSGRRALVLALSGASVLGAIASLISLF